MIKKIKSLSSTLLLISILQIMIGCMSTKSTISVDTTPISVSIDLVNVINDKVKVEIKVPNLTLDTISYYIPQIVPGTYQNNNYGKYIEDFKAFDKLGNPLTTKKQDDNQWKINKASQLSTITYLVNDTFDIEDTHDVFSPTGTNIDKDKNFILNLYAFVGYFNALKDRKYRLFIKHPLHLEASTSLNKVLPKVPAPGSSYDIDLYAINTYSDVVDTPIMYSIPDKVIFNINEMEVLLSVYSPNNTYRAAQLMPQMERMVRAQKKFLATINTTKKYSILLYLSTAKEGHAKGFGALEHNTSTVVVLPESIPLKKLNESLTDIVSHEFFHIVTPLHIHSKEIHNFDYNNPKMSKHLWLYEGTTEYFSLLFQIHQALITKEEFLDRVLEKINNAKMYDDTMSFTEMSQDILKEPYHQNYPNVYEKGALISMCIDLIIREESNGRSGLIDLVKELSEKFGSEIPFDDDQLISHIKKMSYQKVANFLTSHVVNSTPINYDFYLKKAGVLYSSKDIPSQYFIHEQEPFIKGSEATNQVIFTDAIAHHNFLTNSGIKGGDILTHINKKKYTLKNIYDLFSDSAKWKIGDTIVFDIIRDGELLKFVSIVSKPTVKKVLLDIDPSASSLQTAVLKGWIND